MDSGCRNRFFLAVSISAEPDKSCKLAFRVTSLLLYSAMYLYSFELGLALSQLGVHMERSIVLLPQSL